jgi:hypothetical protein
VIRRMITPTTLGLLALVLIWAFVSYLDPAFTGELTTGLLVCN